MSLIALGAFGFSGYWAGLLHAGQAGARSWVLCALLALASLIVVWANLKKVIRLSIPPMPDIVPVHFSGKAQDHFDGESRLEHAPIALFSLKANEAVRPLNGNARRLLAPGRVSEKSQLLQTLKNLKHLGRALIEFESERGIERALVANNQINLHGEIEQLIALMPVESELQLEAQNAWLKLLRVLIHEINNSLTPVASLSRTASEVLADKETLFVDEQSKQEYCDLQTALEAIHRRSSGLSDFVNHTRDLTNLAPAKPSRVSLATIFAHLESLFSPGWKSRGGALIFSCEPKNLEVILDPQQFEQALINLIQNAYDATENTANASLNIAAKLTHGARLKIEITDNGEGIGDEHLQHIFTPFFSTKEKGSGIGLALTRQLIQNNGGTVRYAKSVEGGAKFIISL